MGSCCCSAFSDACFQCIGSCCNACGPCYNYSNDAAFLEQRGPLQDVPENDPMQMRPLRSIGILSSHNSFLRTIQNGGTASLDALDRCLSFGVRALELDVYQTDRENGIVEPIVAHGTTDSPWGDVFSSTTLSFERIIAHLADVAFRETEEPLFLCLEMNVRGNRAACDRIADILEDHFGEKLLRGHVATHLPEETLQSLRGKVVVIPKNGSVRGTKLPAISYETLRNRSSNVDVNDIRYTTDLVRIYPAAGSVGTFFSYNRSLTEFFPHANFIAMNFQVFDEPLENYLTSFGPYRFRELL